LKEKKPPFGIMRTKNNQKKEEEEFVSEEAMR
jgi:hypothetical protein